MRKSESKTARKYYIGIDLGGTFIKGGIVDDAGNIVVCDEVPTERDKGAKVVAKNIAALCDRLLSAAGLCVSDAEGVGIGVPGLINAEKGKVVYSNNLDWHDFGIVGEVQKRTGLRVVIANDADVAALAEYKFGAGKGVSDCVMLTLGTGVGGGVIINGSLYTGNSGAGAEIGHTVLKKDGEQCTCGLKGCLEAYCSATALIRETKRAMTEDKNSAMWNVGDLNAVTGKTAFDYYHSDAAAKKVVDNYLEDLSIGVINVANAFRPQVIIIGGGISAQKDIIIPVLQKAVDEYSYGGRHGLKFRIVSAKAGNKAGILGAATLVAAKLTK